MKYKYLEYKNDSGTAWVYINRPEQRNSLNKETLFELIDAFNAINNDDSVKAAILIGNGKTFVGGADLKEMVNMNAFDYLEFGSIYAKLNKVIRENSKPVIGAANGHALGGGNVLIMSSDIIVAAENAKFALPEINLGIFGGAALMPGIVGRYRASELVLLGEAYTAQRAYEMGIVNKVVPPGQLIETVTEIANKIKEKSPSAVKIAKKALMAGLFYDINTATEIQTPLLALLYSGNDQKEGMNSFFEKRKPVFTGK